MNIYTDDRRRELALEDLTRRLRSPWRSFLVRVLRHVRSVVQATA